MRPDSGLAATQVNAFSTNGRRVYWQDQSGNIRESGTDGGPIGSNWSNPAGIAIPAQQVIGGTKLAAVSWDNSPDVGELMPRNLNTLLTSLDPSFLRRSEHRLI